MRRRFVLYRSNATRLPSQLELALAPGGTRPVVLPSRRTQTYLDYGVFDVFHDLESAAHVALRLESQGVIHIGQLIQLAEGHLRALARADDCALAAMRLRLSAAGLRFGMGVPAAQDFSLPRRVRL